MVSNYTKSIKPTNKQTKQSKMSATIMMPQAIDAGIREMCAEAMNQTVVVLSAKYGFDADEASRFLSNEEIKLVRKRGPSPMEVKRGTSDKTKTKTKTKNEDKPKRAPTGIMARRSTCTTRHTLPVDSRGLYPSTRPAAARTSAGLRFGQHAFARSCQHRPPSSSTGSGASGSLSQWRGLCSLVACRCTATSRAASRCTKSPLLPSGSYNTGAA